MRRAPASTGRLNGRLRLLHHQTMSGTAAAAPSVHAQQAAQGQGGALLRVLQINVFEDGLTDAPAAIGLSPEFTDRFNHLLLALSDDGSGNRFLCFKKARDLSVLPAVAPLISAAEFFGFVDLAYNVLYHPLGGEARLADAADTSLPPPGPDLANCLRTLFLCSAVDDASGAWSSPKFEAELEKALGSDAAAAATAGRIQAIRDRVFDRDHGTLGWDRGEVTAIWKRGNNAWHDKWCKDLSAFLAAEKDGADEHQLAALMPICQSGTEALTHGGMQSFIYVQVDGAGVPVRITSCTMHSAIRLLLRQMCAHSLQSDAASAALCAFSGADVAPATPAARADLIAGPLMVEVESWSERASIQMRHVKVCETVAYASPSIITLVEFDGQWRSLPPPTNRAYRSARDLEPARGTGQATIMFDSEEFAAVGEEELAGMGVASPVVLPGIVRSQKDQGVGESPVRLKSSCMLLLRRRESTELVLVAAVHLESAPPSDTKKVALRRQQLRALLSEVSLLAKQLSSAGLKCTVALGGDFNATREEFVHGNLPAFYECEGTKMVTPALLPPVTAMSAEGMGTAIARMDLGLDDHDGGSGGLLLLCDGVDGGELIEGTLNPAEQPGHGGGRVGCTRAGKSMVIDFVFCGTIGHTGAGDGAAAGSPVTSTVFVLASDEEAKVAADEGYGVLSAVMRWGSDHLPVACDIKTAAD